jgi:diketogulonate reductase-like aldo/keto reductase
MQSSTFGPLDAAVPLVGQGTWNLERDDQKRAVAALEAGIGAGMTHLDTAELYGSGRVERLLKRVVQGRREALFLVSKVLPHNATYEGTIEACERSLRRLGTDRLDVYLLHWRGGVPLEETFGAFEALEKAGKIRAFGVSNFGVDDLDEALAIAGEGRIACNQVLYHLTERSIEYAVGPWCRDHGVALVAYSPFGSGHFPTPRSEGGRVLQATAEAHAASPHQVALAFLIRRAGAFAIPKAAVVEHALDNAAAGDLALTAEEMREIDRAFPAQRRRGLAML